MGRINCIGLTGRREGGEYGVGQTEMEYTRKIHNHNHGFIC